MANNQPNAVAFPLLNVIAGSAATRTLSEWESGSTCLFDAATGIKFILPTPVVGTYFDFVVTVSASSATHEVDTDGAATFIVGIINGAPTATASKTFTANGTSHVKIAMDGATKGGVLGTIFRMTCVSATLWAIRGQVVSVGTLVTPFA